MSAPGQPATGTAGTAGTAGSGWPTPLSDADAAVAQRFLATVARLQREGLHDEIAALAPLLAGVSEPRLRGEMARLLGFYWLRRQDFAQAIAFSDEAVRLLPDQPDGHYNAAFACFSAGRHDDAIARARTAMQRFGEELTWHNLLCTALGAAGRIDQAREHGTRALQLKDALTRTLRGRDLAAVPVPALDATQPARQVISFSLFGQQAKYLDGALHNATAARYVYPGWACRFHVDASVPEATLAALRAQGAQVLHMPNELPAAPWGPLWRFLVADDATVARFIVRDADSLINPREAAAVQAWVTSGRHFHIMRDHINHSELVLAGMWGGVRGALPPLRPAAQAFLARGGAVPARTADQEFLRELLWPTIRCSAWVHDSQFGFGERQPFPPHVQLPPGCHVGGDAQRLLAPWLRQMAGLEPGAHQR